MVQTQVLKPVTLGLKEVKPRKTSSPSSRRSSSRASRVAAEWKGEGSGDIKGCAHDQLFRSKTSMDVRYGRRGSRSLNHEQQALMKRRPSLRRFDRSKETPFHQYLISLVKQKRVEESIADRRAKFHFAKEQLHNRLADYFETENLDLSCALAYFDTKHWGYLSHKDFMRMVEILELDHIDKDTRNKIFRSYDIYSTGKISLTSLAGTLLVAVKVPTPHNAQQRRADQ